jgi:hydrogenase/urease accessory protein HupE
MAFSILLLVGLALAPLELLGAWRTSALLACTLAVGLLVAAARQVPRYASAALAGLMALLLGLDSTPDEHGLRASVIMLAGVGVGVHLLLLNAVALTSSRRRPGSRSACG